MTQVSGICFYIGDFNPPTRYHLETAKWLASRPNITEVCIVVGKSEPGGLSQDQKTQLWEIYFKAEPAFGLRCHKSEKSNSLVEVHNIIAKDPQMPCYIALDEKSAKNKKLQSYFESFPNYQIELIPSQYKNYSKKMLDCYSERAKHKFKSLLPPTCNEEQCNKAWEIMGQNKKNEPKTYDDLMEKYIKTFNDGFWKSVLKLD